MKQTTKLSCACGKVEIEVTSAPIIGAECHCNSCRSAGARLESLPTARPLMDADGGTPFVLYRKDRVRFVKGAELLREFRLTLQAKTRRVVSGCCKTPMFLEFESGHWLSLYGSLWPDGSRPPMDLRTMTGDRTDGVALDDDVPSGKLQTARFYAKLIGAWIAMGFRSPRITITGDVRA